MYADGGEPERRLVTVATEPHEQGLVVEQGNAARGDGPSVMSPARPARGQRRRDLALTPALGAYEQPVVPGASTRAAQITGARAGGGQSAVAEHPQQGVVASAGQRSAIGNP